MNEENIGTYSARQMILKIGRQEISFVPDQLQRWARNSSVPRSIIGELRGAFRFRHWLAHGRYWTPNLGRRYGFSGVFALADLTLHSFPFGR